MRCLFEKRLRDHTVTLPMRYCISKQLHNAHCVCRPMTAGGYFKYPCSKEGVVG